MLTGPYARYGTIVLSMVQGYFIAQWLESSNRNYSQLGSVVVNPGLSFKARSWLAIASSKRLSSARATPCSDT